VRAVGLPADESVEGLTLDGMLLAAAAEAILRVRLAGGLWAVASMQAGHVLMGHEVLAGDRRLGGIGGPLFGLDIGVVHGF
jgi:hypothetical protein